MIVPIDLHRENPYFDRNIPVTITSNPDEIKLTDLTFRIIPGVKQVKQAGPQERIIHFELADENDPYFLYVLDVGEQDFHHLKRDQAILVEFPVFPTKFIELIDLCLHSASVSSSTSGVVSNNIHGNTSFSSSTSLPISLHDTINNNTSQFSARLDQTTGVFSIVESNMFKQLTHISLQLRPGNDTVIKAYLSSRLKYTINVAKTLAKDLETTQATLSLEQSERKTLDTELHDLKVHKESYFQSLTSAHSEEIATMQVQYMHEQERVRVAHEESLKVVSSQIEDLRIQSSNKIASLEALLAESNQSRSELHSAVRDRDTQLAALTSERDKLLLDMDKMSEQRVRSDESRLQLEREAVRLASKIDSLQYQLSDKDELMSKTVALQHACEESKQQLEEKLQFYIQTNESLQVRIRDTVAEINKGNQTITQQQNDISQLRDKIRLKGEVIRRQELSINDFRHKSSDLDRQLTTTKELLESSKTQNQVLQHQVDDARNRLQESSKLVASNQEIISYLNDELNKWQLGMSVGGQVEYDYSVSTLAKLAKVASTPTPTAYANYTATGATATTTATTSNSRTNSNMDRNKSATYNNHTSNSSTYNDSPPIGMRKYEKQFQVVSVTPDTLHQSESSTAATPSLATGHTRGGGADFVTYTDTIPSIYTQAEHSTAYSNTYNHTNTSANTYNNSNTSANNNNLSVYEKDRQVLLQGMRNLGLNEKEDSLVAELGLNTNTYTNTDSGTRQQNAATAANSSTVNKGRGTVNTKTAAAAAATDTHYTVSPLDYMHPYEQSSSSALAGAAVGAAVNSNNYNNYSSSSSSSSSNSEGYSQSDLDLLEAMDYYNTNIHTNTPTYNTNTNTSNNTGNNRYNSKAQQQQQQQSVVRPQYSWQNDDFLFSNITASE